MPEPIKGEKLSTFVGRYMGSGEARKSFPKQSQRAAVAYSEFRNRSKKKESRSKLDEGKAAEIRRRRSAGESLDSLSRSFGISRAMASRVGRNEAWKDRA
jgi:hypothetical protein